MTINSPANSTPQRDFTLQKIVSRYQKPSRWRSLWQLSNSLGLYCATLVAMYYSLEISYWLTLGLAVLAAGFMIRIFIIFHDCGHGSFWRSKRWNNIWGAITGVITFTPFHCWTVRHAYHHETAGDLDRRGVGDVWTMTVNEYLASSKGQRAWYRFYRHPLVLFVLGPLQVLLIQNRRILPNSTKKDVWSVIGTNIALAAIIAVVSLTLGFKTYLLIQIPIILIGLSLGIWLFYVQHQFEGVYWEHSDQWDFEKASMEGSSFYRLPRALQWFSGNIGYHHIHHLNSRIPNYYLERCHKAVVGKREIPEIGFWRSFKAMNYRLYDEDRRELISFRRFKLLYAL